MATTSTKRPTPIRIQLATLADAARINLFVANKLMEQLAKFEPDSIPRSYVDACILTNQRLTELLSKAPTLHPEDPALAVPGTLAIPPIQRSL